MSEKNDERCAKVLKINATATFAVQLMGNLYETHRVIAVNTDLIFMHCETDSAGCITNIGRHLLVIRFQTEVQTS